MSLPKLSETLTGRAAILELWPFSVGETLRVHETFVEPSARRLFMVHNHAGIGSWFVPPDRLGR